MNIKELIKQSPIVKDIKILFSNIFSEGKEYKSDSIYNFSCLDEKEYNKFNLIKQITKLFMRKKEKKRRKKKKKISVKY